jgi:hypothetical protein
MIHPSPIVRRRILGLLALTFFSLHTFYYLWRGGLSHMLWMCNIGNLLLSIGLLFNWAILIRIAVFWLIPGLFCGSFSWRSMADFYSLR